MVLLSVALGVTAQNKKVNRPTSYNYLRGLEIIKDAPQEALVYFNKDIEENPKNGYSYMWIAVLRANDDEFGKALTASDLSIKYIPKKDTEYLSYAYAARAGIYANLEDTVKAIEDLTTAIRISPDDTNWYDKRAQIYYEQQKYDLADADYRKMVELKPGDVMGYMGIGRNAKAQERWDDAIKQFDYVIKLDNNYSSGYSFRAEAYLSQKQYQKAIQDICEALEIDSDDKAYVLLYEFPVDQLNLVVAKLKGLCTKKTYSGEYWYYIGLLYHYHNMYAESNEALAKGYEIDAHDATLEYMAMNCQSLGDYASALNYVERGIQINPDDTDLISLKANILGESGDYEAAVAVWGEYIERNPDKFEGYYRRGWFNDVAMNTDAALEDYKMATMLEPDFCYAHFGLAEMYVRKGELDNAKAEYQKVIELDTIPDNNSCAMYALLALDRKDDAVAFLNKVIEQDSINPGNYYDATCLFSRMGEYETAMQHLNTCLAKGFRRFHHVRHDDDLEPLRVRPDFEPLIQKYETLVTNHTEHGTSDNNAVTTGKPVEIPFTQDGGCASVKCSINNLPLSFIFDTGASTVSISMTEANFMLKNGYLNKKDIVGSSLFMNADGNINEGTIINLKEVDFGGLKLKNVRASVVRNQKAPLLLGQSVLSRLGKIEIDNHNKILLITPFE